MVIQMKLISWAGAKISVKLFVLIDFTLYSIRPRISGIVEIPLLGGNRGN